MRSRESADRLITDRRWVSPHASACSAILSATAVAALLTAGTGVAAPDGRTLFVRAWTASQGLGPAFNATSCLSCHPEAIARDASADAQAFVWFARGISDPTGGALFRRFTVTSRGAVTAHVPPRGATRRRPPRLPGLSVFESLKPSSQTQGRYGWKARYPTLTDAVAAALAGEMGLTTSRFPGAEAGDDAPEVTDLQLAALVAFVRSLPPPAQSDLRGPGAQIFERLGCRQCHSMTPVGPDRLAVRPFSDLQLYDLGPALADYIQEGAASGRQFRTAPLWGLRFVTQGYLHDGRAASLDEAIAAHAGAADAAARRYETLAPSDRADLLSFLQGL